MTNLVPASEIEKRVGAQRHALAHLAHASSVEQVVYILHSQECLDTGIDLRSCNYSLALDRGIYRGDWEHHQDRVVTLRTEHCYLMPDDDGPDDVELIGPEPE